MKILYAGDGPAGGPANYLLAILKSLKADVVHLPPSEKLTPDILQKKFDAFLLSDFSAKQCPSASQSEISNQVKKGSGLIMIGGWGSFSGPFGGWHKTLIEELLPVDCAPHDDRVNFPGGALVAVKTKHTLLNQLSFEKAPVICGLNKISPKPNSQVLLTAKKIISDGKKISFQSAEYPLLVVNKSPKLKTVAFATDAAPHWCGGLVDWGSRSCKLPVNKTIRVEVGDMYVRFFATLIRWLASK